MKFNFKSILLYSVLSSTFILAACDSDSNSSPDIDQNLNVYADPQVQAKSVFSELSTGETIHHLETGSGDTIVFLHGLPASAYLWRDVLPLVGQEYKAISADLPGYGYSDAPFSGDYSFTSLAESLSEYIDQIADEPIILVVTDMGSVLGLNYIVENSDKIKALVMVEAAYMPAGLFLKQVTPEHIEFMQLLQDDVKGRAVTIENASIVESTLQKYSVKTLSDNELSHYSAPYFEPEDNYMAKREVLFRAFAEGGAEEFSAMANENAEALINAQLPTLLLNAKPGFMNNPAAIEYAIDNFQDLIIVEIEAASHFAPEDQPELIAEAIITWAKTLED